MALPVSGHRKSSILPLPFIETESLADKYVQDGIIDSDKGDFYDVTQDALQAAGTLPTLRVDGPFGAPSQDVFKAEGAQTSQPARSDTLIRPLTECAL